jgi:hypothetical protein
MLLAAGCPINRIAIAAKGNRHVLTMSSSLITMIYLMAMKRRALYHRGLQEDNETQSHLGNQRHWHVYPLDKRIDRAVDLY